MRPQQWHVYRVIHAKVRGYQKEQPEDGDGQGPKPRAGEKDETRLYVILSPVKDDHFTVTCCGIGGHRHSIHNVALRKNEGGTTKDCFVWVQDLYTFDIEAFTEKPGVRLPNERIAEIKNSLRDFLDLWEDEDEPAGIRP